MIQLEKPVPTGTMPVVWPTILDLGRDECKRILRKLGKNNFSCLELPNQRILDNECKWNCPFIVVIRCVSAM